jgi:hypothetical protein
MQCSVTGHVPRSERSEEISMADEKRNNSQQNVQSEAGEPSRTPGSAEGEREQIDHALEEKNDKDT